MNGKKSTIRSFRLDNDTQSELAKVAAARGVTENSYVSNLLGHAVKTDCLDRVFDKIAISKDIFRSILSYVQEDYVEIVGYEMAKQNLRFSFELLRLELDEPSLTHFIKTVLSDSYRWFKAEFDYSEGETLLIHEYGIKWSMFLNGYLSSAYDTCRLNAAFNITERIVKIKSIRERPYERPIVTRSTT